MFELLAKFCGRILGPILQALGLVGAAIPPPVQEGILKTLLTYAADPFFFVPSAIIGTVLTTVLWGELWAERKIKLAGGLSKQEFPVSVEEWDRIFGFTVWQAAWLWRDLQPRMGDTEGVHPNSPAYPTYRTFKEHLELGVIENVKQVNGSWFATELSRQQLIDYALLMGDWPKFLFQNERAQWSLLFVPPIVPYKKARSDYQSLSDHWARLDMAAISLALDDDPSAGGLIGYRAPDLTEQRSLVRRMVREQIQRGDWEIVGRRRVGSLLYAYREIPQWMLEEADIGSEGLTWCGITFRDLRYKERKRRKQTWDAIRF